jgi:DNA end-binding protein Ku
MRPIWNGSISFGLLQVPVQLFSATRDIDLHFRMLDGRDKKPIRYERVNEETGHEVPWKEIVKAYEVKKGNFLVVDEKEIKRAAPEQTQTIDIEAFVDRCDIDPIYFEKPYFLVPDKRAGKAYGLLRAALEKSGKVGIARVVIRTRQYLAAVLPEKQVLMLTLMRFAEEVVDAKTLGLTDAKVKAKSSSAELDMADKLLQSMSKKWNPDDYHDEFRTKLRAILERKGKSHALVKEPKHEEETAPKDNVIDLVSVLQKSLKTPRRAAGRTTRRATKAKRSAR